MISPFFKQNFRICTGDTQISRSPGRQFALRNIEPEEGETEAEIQVFDGQEYNPKLDSGSEANGILEAEAYIKDIQELGNEDLQRSVETWERSVEAGSGQAALKVALYKQSQVFYIANSYEIEKAFLEALGLGSYQAAYELGKIYHPRR